MKTKLTIAMLLGMTAGIHCGLFMGRMEADVNLMRYNAGPYDMFRNVDAVTAALPMPSKSGNQTYLGMIEARLNNSN